MLESENHNYWNVLGVISMSKGNLNLVTFICTQGMKRNNCSFFIRK